MRRGLFAVSKRNFAAKSSPPPPPIPSNSWLAENPTKEAIEQWYGIPNLKQKFRKVPSTGPDPHILYQMSMCPFCNKLKTLLAVQKVPHRVVEVDPVSMAEVPHKTYKKVPQFQCGEGGPLLLDSAEIGNILAPILDLGRDPESDRWRAWSGDVLARYLAITFAWSPGSSAKYVVTHPNLTPAHKVKYLGAGVFMYIAAGRVVAPKLNKLGYETKEPVASMLLEVRKWGQTLKGGAFYGGAPQPGLVDCDVFGVLQGVRGHPLYEQVKTEGGDPVRAWMAAMEDRVRGGL